MRSSVSRIGGGTKARQLLPSGDPGADAGFYGLRQPAGWYPVVVEIWVEGQPVSVISRESHAVEFKYVGMGIKDLGKTIATFSRATLQPQSILGIWLRF